MSPGGLERLGQNPRHAGPGTSPGPPAPYSPHLLPAGRCRQRKPSLPSADRRLAASVRTPRAILARVRGCDLARGGRSFRPEGRVTQRVRRSSADKGGSVWRASGEGGLNAEPSEFRLVPGFLLLPHYRSSPSSRVGKSRVDHDPAYPSEPVRTEVRVGWSS